MIKEFEMVKQFHEACSIHMPNVPTQLDEAEKVRRWHFLYEELLEFSNAYTVTDQADALIDIIYFAIGTFTLMGVKPSEIFEIVHQANMQKVGPDGKVIRNDQGKIQKPAGWEPPEKYIALEIECQRKESVT